MCVCADGVYGDYYLVRVGEGEHITCEYEGTKLVHDKSQLIPVPVSKGCVCPVHDLQIDEGLDCSSTVAYSSSSIY